MVRKDRLARQVLQDLKAPQDHKARRVIRVP